MFTGLVQDTGRVTGITRKERESEIRIETKLCPLNPGESIAVMGICLSVTGSGSKSFSAFASGESLDVTKIGSCCQGDRVNLEKALTLATPLGGHLVTGHVDTMVRLLKRTPKGDAHSFTFSSPKEDDIRSHIVPKGSVAIDGVSLTVNRADDTSFEVMVIPLTLKKTTLCNISKGDYVNLETDLLAKYVAGYAKDIIKRTPEEEGLSLKLLQKSGFTR